MVIEEKNSRVGLLYTVRLSNGEIVKGAPETGREHMDFFTGYEQVLPGLETRLIGRQQGEDAEFTVPAAEAFGDYDPSLVQEKSFDEMPEARSFREGGWMVARNEEHKISCGFFVQQKKADGVVLDYNHPLAGKDLRYTIHISEVRPATQEELEILKPCRYDPDAQMNEEEL